MNFVVRRETAVSSTVHCRVMACHDPANKENMEKITDLRSYITALEAAGQLARITKPVDLVHELADVAATLVRNGGGAPLFENVNGSQWPIFSSGVANQKRAAIATAVNHRANPIYQTIIPGWYEHIYIGNVLPREPLLRSFVRHLHPTATVHIPPYANGFAAIVQIKRDNPGQPKNLAMAAMTAHINIRNVIVVDEDINIYDPADVLWALTNRGDWQQDVFQVPNAQGHEMDPVANMRGVSTKLGIDATYKRERREYGERVSYPMVDLKEYFDL